jgi:hypothetical protein
LYSISIQERTIVITVFVKNRPWSGEPHCDFVRVVSQFPQVIKGYAHDGFRLKQIPIPTDYLKTYSGWFHPATAWEIAQFHRMERGE